jgi:hypothetical protein
VPKKDNALHASIVKEYEDRESKGNTDDKLKKKEILELIPKLAAARSKVTIVIDGIDECDPITREEILDTLCDLLKSIDKLWVFVSSRPYREIEDKLPKARFEVAMNAKRNTKDIEKFIAAQIKKARDKERPNKAEKLLRDDDELREEVAEGVLRKSGGM